MFTLRFFGLNLRLDTGTLLAETCLVQHVVGFIKHENLDAGWVDHASLDLILNCAWRTDKYMCVEPLVPPAWVWDSGHGLEAIHKLAHMCDNSENLSSKFAAGRKSKRLWLNPADVDARQYVERESGRLAGT